MDSIRKDVFQRTLLSSAILVSIQSFSASAATCPSSSPGGNIHIPAGESCSGGIAHNLPVNDIGIEGVVQGDIVNSDGMSSFWMNDGTLNGSFINQANALDAMIMGQSQINYDIRNHGFIKNITLAGDPSGSPTVYGSIINTARVKNAITVSAATVGQQLVNEGDVRKIVVTGGANVDQLTNNDRVRRHITINNATITGVVSNNGTARNLVIKNGASVASVTNSGHLGNALKIREESVISGDVSNHGQAGSVVVAKKARVDGNIINSKLAVAESIRVTSGASVTGSIENTGTIVQSIPEPTPPLLVDGVEPLDELPPPPPPGLDIESTAGISVSGGTTSDIINSGTIAIHSGLEHDSFPFQDGITVNGIEVRDQSQAESITNLGSISADTYGIGYVAFKGW